MRRSGPLKTRAIRCLANPANVNIPNECGVTPLEMLCLTTGEPLSTLVILLKNGANPNRGFLRACRNADRRKMQLLLHYGANLDLQDDEGKTAIHHLVNEPELLQWLLSKGAECELLDKQGNRPLDYVSRPDVIEMLKR